MANPVMVQKRMRAKHQAQLIRRPDDSGPYMPGYRAAEQGYLDGYHGRHMAPGSVKNATYRAAFVRGRAYATTTGAYRTWGKETTT
jgi:hypothetical protein